MTTPVHTVHSEMPADSVRHTDRLWDATADLRAAIDDLEFLHLLGTGTLPLDAFRTYIEQDELYLAGYAKALSILASRAPNATTAAFWANSAAGAVEEASLHQSLLGSELLPDPRSTGSEHSSACLGYVSYLIAAAATEPYAVAAAAILPCFWIYADVAVRLSIAAREVLGNDPDHPYARWVSTYDSDEFRAVVEGARVLVDDAAAHATEADRTAMTVAFRIATRYELTFWDTALHPTPWPVAL